MVNSLSSNSLLLTPSLAQTSAAAPQKQLYHFPPQRPQPPVYNNQDINSSSVLDMMQKMLELFGMMFNQNADASQGSYPPPPPPCPPPVSNDNGGYDSGAGGYKTSTYGYGLSAPVSSNTVAPLSTTSATKTTVAAAPAAQTQSLSELAKVLGRG